MHYHVQNNLGESLTEWKQGSWYISSLLRLEGWEKRGEKQNNITAIITGLWVSQVNYFPLFNLNAQSHASLINLTFFNCQSSPIAFSPPKTNVKVSP